MPAIAFVTTELAPFTGGGIGRLLHNILQAMSVEDRQRTYVLMLDGAVTAYEFDRHFPGAHLVCVDTETANPRQVGPGLPMPRAAFANASWHWKSIIAYQAVRDLAGEVEIAYLEFPDWGGLAFTTLQEARISGFLARCTIAVRLHSDHTMLAIHEGQLIDAAYLNACDLERKCLRDCDLIVAQSIPVAEQMRLAHVLSAEEWQGRCVRHVNAICLDGVAAAREVVVASDRMPIVFGTKWQAIKRPDTFMRGASAFLCANREYRGDIVMCAHNPSQAYRNELLARIDGEFAPRFKILDNLSETRRRSLIASSVFVLPSEFEALCLAAYEAALSGARMVLNGANPAFGEQTPWIDGRNCFKYDGTAMGLANALERCVSEQATLQVVEVEVDPAPWTLPALPARQWLPPSSDPLVSIIVLSVADQPRLIETLSSAVDQRYGNIEILVIDSGGDPASKKLIARLADKSVRALRVIECPGLLNEAAARNCAIADATGRYVCVIGAGDVMDPDFISITVAALENNPQFAALVSPAALTSEYAQQQIEFWPSVGEAVAAGLHEPLAFGGAAVYRKSALASAPYCEAIDDQLAWSLNLSLMADQARVLVTTGAMVRGYAAVDQQAADRISQLVARHNIMRTSLARKQAPALHFLCHCVRLDNVGEPRMGVAPAMPVAQVHSATLQDAEFNTRFAAGLDRNLDAKIDAKLVSRLESWIDAKLLGVAVSAIAPARRAKVVKISQSTLDRWLPRDVAPLRIIRRAGGRLLHRFINVTSG